MQLIIDFLAIVANPAVLLVLLFAAFLAGCCAAWLLLVVIMGADERTEHLQSALHEADQLLMKSESHVHRLRAEVEQLRNAMRVHEAA